MMMPKLLRAGAVGLLALSAVAVAIISQLDNLTTGQLYTAVSSIFHLDLRQFNMTAVQISDNGHIVAGFVLAVLAQLTFRRWWAIPLVMGFMVALELAQLFSAERQTSFADVLRGWGGAGGAWFFRGRKVRGTA